LIECRNGTDLRDRFGAMGIECHHCNFGGEKEEIGFLQNMIDEDTFPDTTVYECPFCYEEFEDEELGLIHLETVHREARENVEEKCILWRFGRFCADFCLINGQVVDFENEIMARWKCRYLSCYKNFDSKEDRDSHESERHIGDPNLN
jgi:hypothetical protein